MPIPLARLSTRLTALLGGLLLLFAASAWGDPARVGEITLKLGEAWLVAGDERRAAAAGAPVFAGDRLETGATGHLHVRFIDGGVLSVRPRSRLAVFDYGDPAAGGAIRFHLEEGVVRSITGRFGEADRQRFRLNTPIAAIGIRGTDFLVEGNADLTRVQVFSGAIIAAPLGGDCRAEDLGPCAGEASRELSAAMSGYLLEIRRDQAAPLIKPANGKGEEMQLPVQPPAAKSEALTQAEAQAQAAQPPLPATLVWGRWAHAPAWPADTLAVPREQAAQGRERIAENSRYVLYRLPQEGPLPTGSLSFTLAGASAHLLTPDSVSPAQVLGGALTLDFAARRFATTLELDAAATGRVPFAASGPIRPDGSFGLIEVQTRLQGAWGSGGSGPSAAYLFERATPAGMFMGITQWR